MTLGGLYSVQCGLRAFVLFDKKGEGFTPLWGGEVGGVYFGWMKVQHDVCGV